MISLPLVSHAWRQWFGLVEPMNGMGLMIPHPMLDVQAIYALHRHLHGG